MSPISIIGVVIMPSIDVDRILCEIFRLEWSMNHENLPSEGVVFDEIPDARSL